MALFRGFIRWPFKFLYGFNRAAGFLDPKSIIEHLESCLLVPKAFVMEALTGASASFILR